MYLISPFSLFLSLCVFLIGASIGSFINMAAYRIPLDLSIIKPRSYCNNCKTTLPFFALIPILGYFLSRGKCTKCKMRIPLEYPLVELLCGVFFVYLFFTIPMSIQLLIAIWLFSSGLLLSIIDFKHHILPDVIVIPGIMINLILGSLNPNLGFKESFIGALVGGLGLFLISKLYEWIRKKEGMGFGDVKYLAFLGALLGWQGVLFTLFLASILGSVLGILFLWIQKKNLHTPIPFGPFLALAGLICFLSFQNYSFSIVI